MAKRTKVPKNIRDHLIAEAGGKCANPGCANRRTESHHIKQWAVYRSHDGAHMIAVCPACHDAIHNGALPLLDATLHEWKQLARSSEVVRDHIWVEPGASTRLLLGSIALAPEQPVIVFELSDRNDLSFRVEGEDILLATLRMSSLANQEVVRVEGNTLRCEPRSDISYRRIPGRIEIYVPATEEFIPAWALGQMRRQEPHFGLGARIKYLGLRVERPGILRVEGVWAAEDRVIIATSTRLSFCRSEFNGPLSLVGQGAESVLVYRGPVTAAMFGFR